MPKKKYRKQAEPAAMTERRTGQKTEQTTEQKIEERTGQKTEEKTEQQTVKKTKAEQMKEQKTVQTTKQENDQSRTDNIINVVNCQNVQLGDGNVLTVCSGVDYSACVDHKDEKTKDSREQLGILFLTKLLERFYRPPSLEELEGSVKDELKCVQAKSFRELSDWNLRDFLIKHKNIFDVFKKKGIKCVRLKSKHRSSRTVVKKAVDDGGVTKANEQLIVVYERETQEVESVDNNNDHEDMSDTWVEVKSKRNARRDRVQHIESRTIEMKAMSNFDEGKFELLLKKGECDDILHVPSLDVYMKSPLLFSLHLASMWNTPQRVKSYIIAGISSGVLSGIDKPLDDSVCQGLFQQSHFSQRPHYTCYTSYYNEMLFGIIEIGSSYGQGSPCAVKQVLEVEEAKIRSEVGDVLTRKGGNYIVNKTTDMDLSLVYQWFLGKTGLDGQNQSNENGESTSMDTRFDIDNSDSDEEFNASSALNVSSGNTVEHFLSSVKTFQRGHFVLLAGDVPNTTKNLEALAIVPWICVYDFDIFSCSDGLLNIVQDKLGTRRHLRLRTHKEPVESISEHSTWWCFMRGRKEIPDSRTDHRHNEIESTNTWMRRVKNNLYNNCESLARFAADYTVLTIVVLWPKNKQLLPFMSKQLDRLNETLTSTPNIVVCINKEPETSIEDTFLNFLNIEFRTSLTVCQLDFENLFHGIFSCMSSNEERSVSYVLPTDEGHTGADISEIDAAWLRDDFEVLYLHNPYTKGLNDEDELDEEINTFYKGGNLHWFAWYKRNGDNDQIPIERERAKTLEDKIRPHLEEFKTSVITVFHAPGSGGTTLGQSVLWKFHQKVPSVHMKLRTGSTNDELVKKVSFLYDKTGLPVLILIDGEEDTKVRYLSKRLKYAILVYVKRYPYRIPSGSVNVKDGVFLEGLVTPEEATRLSSKFGEKRDEKKRNALERLKKDVCLKNINHYLFEFGMTVYLHEFKGVVSFVQGYLQLKKASVGDLTPWQKCLGYLSLVYFYGQTSVPCQFFAALFGKPSNYNMTLEEDFPHPVEQFVVYETNNSRRNNIRICHYIVAKEILEQILTGREDVERQEHLSERACRNLSRFCLDFIEYASKKRKISSAISLTLRIVLAKTFIFRDGKDISENEEQSRRRPVLSKLMIDIPGGRPLFTERLKVIQKLSDSFPDDPNFCAHLGRFYAFCRSDDETVAEKCFQKAIQLCEKRDQGKKSEDVDEGNKLSLMHIYHMYGMVKQRSVQKYIKTQRNQRTNCIDESLLKQFMLEIIPIAEHACELFKMCRDITPDSHQVYLFAYTGEIKVRLQICEFALRNFKSESQGGWIPAFLTSEADVDSKAFVQGSISTVENLIMECYDDVDLVGEDISSLRKYVTWFNNLFQRQSISMPSAPTDNSIANRRLQITAKKLKYGISNALTGIENIDDKDDISEIINLYEQNFACVQESGLQPDYSKKDLERDFREWIFAIRHEKLSTNYSLEHVLNHVEKWHEILRSPLSTFYMFVIRSLLGFGRGNSQGKTECLVDAIASKEELSKMTHLIIRPKYPREWLGDTEDGIKQLIPGKRHVGVYSENDISVNFSNLAVCKGTILYPNTNKLSSLIQFDLEIHSVKVFFIPKVVNLEGKRFVNHRVEFRLGFSIEHGFEAYDVKLLKRYGCSICNAKLEFTGADTELQCSCGKEVIKDELNEVK